MNKEQTAERIKVMQAYLDGKTIEFLFGSDWLEVSEPSWEFGKYQYRIKPEPREWNVFVNGKGMPSYIRPTGHDWPPGLERVRVREIID